ncbi:hypothetical protein TNCT_492301 [Trichonephila clavata]|uniref:Uncharacterized protein n=1 Tax=Trichonephila clavata TaxID=2740835 RepID=A0A8X6FV58_TRICU|nr:hypothetical protein TNCT_492301 [Trichonephila clavata]
MYSIETSEAIPKDPQVVRNLSQPMKKLLDVAKRHYNALSAKKFLLLPPSAPNVHNLVTIATHFSCVRVPLCDVMNIKHVSDMQSGNNFLSSSGVKKYNFCFSFDQAIVF